MNVVHGGREAVETLLDAKAVKAISFVGSTPIAETIYSRGSAAGKRVQALGGAKNHAVVLPDADLENAANTLMGAAFGSCGERCMAISVAVCVGDETANRLVETMLPKIAQLKVGPGTEKGLDMGPLVTAEHRDKVLNFIEDGVSAGATLVADGRKLTVPGYEEGYFVGGCLFDNVTAEMRIYQEEIFGPVLCVVRVGSLDDAMQLINDRRFTDGIEVGMVGVNVPLPVPVAYHSFGGWKRSLFGDLHAYGPDSVRFYTRRKAVSQRWPSVSEATQAEFSFPANQS
jgi:malonate-semialdehyde dehydrogenase (acetylating)/methylmalonate-semialdehyde dehydrogenase